MHLQPVRPNDTYNNSIALLISYSIAVIMEICCFEDSVNNTINNSWKYKNFEK